MGGPHEKTRKRSKVTTELPPEIRQEVDRLLIEGVTYEEISMFLKAKGYDISKSSIGRYGKDFLNFYRRVKVVEDKSRALVGEAGEGLVLEEAASKLFLQQILDLLLQGELDIKEKSRIIADFARLQSASVQRERLKSEYKKKADKAVSKIRQKKEISPELLKEIEESIYGIVR